MSPETILRSLVMPLAIHADVRRTRASSATEDRVSMETPVLAHVLDLISVQMQVAMQEIMDTCALNDLKMKSYGGKSNDHPIWSDNEIPSTESSNLEALSPHLTAALRRILPSLRIASKWLRTNVTYLARKALAPASSHTSSSLSLCSKIDHLRSTHAALANLLVQIFPPDELKRLDTALSEDVEMKGFGPLRNSAWGRDDDLGEGDEGEHGKEGHPNEEQLTRIWDFMNDAWIISKLEVGCLLFLS